jgi:hemerythrin-like domain-containing protein
MSIADEVRLEHQHLLAGVDLLKDTGDAAGTESWEGIEEKAELALAFVKTRLIPHAHEEDGHLYPLVADLMGSPEATVTMSRDHVEVARLTRQLEWALQEGDTGAIRRLCYGLYHIVKLHLAKEEEVYLPILERHAEELQPRIFAAP